MGKLSAIANVLQTHGVKYQNKEGVLSASYSRNNEKSYTVYVNEKDNTHLKMDIVFAFTVPLHYMSVMAIHMARRNGFLNYGAYNMDLETGRLSLEYYFRVRDPLVQEDYSEFWKNYEYLTGTASRDLDSLKGLTEGKFPATPNFSYRAFLIATEQALGANKTRSEREASRIAILKEYEKMFSPTPPTATEGETDHDETDVDVRRYFARPLSLFENLK